MNSLDKQYQDLLQDILENGQDKGDRTGTGTRSVFGRQIRHNMKEGFPLLTTKKMPFKTIATELIWFLKGDTNIKYLVENGCNIWNGDAYKNYIKNCKPDRVGPDWMQPDLDFQHLSMDGFVERIKTDEKFAEKWGNLGPVYGKQWRKWSNYSYEFDVSQIIEQRAIDQIYNLIKDLKENPDSRRLMVNAWNVAEIDEMVLPPCHYGFQVYTRELTFAEKFNLVMGEGAWEKNMDNMMNGETFFFSPAGIESKFEEPDFPKRAISLMWNQRSVDTFLGLPFNIASYGLLLEIIAKDVNMVPDQLIGNLGDTHLYLNHLDQAREQIGEFESPKTFQLMGSNKPTLTKRRESYPLPRVEIRDSWKVDSSSPLFADTIKLEYIELKDYQSHGVIKAPLSN